jgi:hypothetical protein
MCLKMLEIRRGLIMCWVWIMDIGNYQGANSLRGIKNAVLRNILSWFSCECGKNNYSSNFVYFLSRFWNCIVGRIESGELSDFAQRCYTCPSRPTEENDGKIEKAQISFQWYGLWSGTSSVPANNRSEITSEKVTVNVMYLSTCVW